MHERYRQTDDRRVDDRQTTDRRTYMYDNIIANVNVSSLSVIIA